MLKDYLQSNNKSIYAIAKESGIPYSTLNDLAGGKVSIDQCRTGLTRRLAKVLGLSMEEVCCLCTEEPLTVTTSYGIPADIIVRNKSYEVEFTYNDAPISLHLCPVSNDTRFYIREIAAWRAEDYIRKQRIEEFR